MSTRRSKKDRGEIIMFSRGVSVERKDGSKDWYIYHTRRTGMWSWSRTQKIAGPLQDNRLAMDIGRDANSRAPVPWGETGYVYVPGDGPHGDPRRAYPGDDVPLTMENPMRRYKKRNPLHGTTEDLLLAGAGVAVAALVGYAMYSKSQAAKTAVTPANQNVTQWNQTTQEAYDAWAVQQPTSGGTVAPA